MQLLLSPVRPARGLLRLFPGIALSIGVATAALAAEHLQQHLVGRAWLEALVLAIVLGMVLRTAWNPPAHFQAGVDCAAKTVLEIAVALMGATISYAVIKGAGIPLLFGVAILVASAIIGGFLLGRILGLPRKMAMLVACGNAICGNSAIAAVAPAINAKNDDVAAAIAFTAVLGVAVVLLLPLGAQALHMSPIAGGALAGLTVYAVPQVIAAAGPMGSVAVQFGTLVKLIRVLMLGPVVAILSLLFARRGRGEPGTRAPISMPLPWFIGAFLLLIAANSAGLLPAAATSAAGGTANLLTIVAMAGLGLSVDLRSIFAAGPRITAVVILSLIQLFIAAFLLLHFIGMH